MCRLGRSGANASDFGVHAAILGSGRAEGIQIRHHRGGARQAQLLIRPYVLRKKKIDDAEQAGLEGQTKTWSSSSLGSVWSALPSHVRKYLGSALIRGLDNDVTTSTFTNTAGRLGHSLGLRGVPPQRAPTMDRDGP